MMDIFGDAFANSMPTLDQVYHGGPTASSPSSDIPLPPQQVSSVQQTAGPPPAYPYPGPDDILDEEEPFLTIHVKRPDHLDGFSRAMEALPALTESMQQWKAAMLTKWQNALALLDVYGQLIEGHQEGETAWPFPPEMTFYMPKPTLGKSVIAPPGPTLPKRKADRQICLPFTDPALWKLMLVKEWHLDLAFDATPWTSITLLDGSAQQWALKENLQQALLTWFLNYLLETLDGKIKEKALAALDRQEEQPSVARQPSQGSFFETTQQVFEDALEMPLPPIEEEKKPELSPHRPATPRHNAPKSPSFASSVMNPNWLKLAPTKSLFEYLASSFPFLGNPFNKHAPSPSRSADTVSTEKASSRTEAIPIPRAEDVAQQLLLPSPPMPSYAAVAAGSASLKKKTDEVDRKKEDVLDPEKAHRHATSVLADYFQRFMLPDYLTPALPPTYGHWQILLDCRMNEQHVSSLNDQLVAVEHRVHQIRMHLSRWRLRFAEELMQVPNRHFYQLEQPVDQDLLLETLYDPISCLLPNASQLVTLPPFDVQLILMALSHDIGEVELSLPARFKPVVSPSSSSSLSSSSSSAASPTLSASPFPAQSSGNEMDTQLPPPLNEHEQEAVDIWNTLMNTRSQLSALQSTGHRCHDHQVSIHSRYISTVMPEVMEEVANIRAQLDAFLQEQARLKGQLEVLDLRLHETQLWDKESISIRKRAREIIANPFERGRSTIREVTPPELYQPPVLQPPR